MSDLTSGTLTYEKVPDYLIGNVVGFSESSEYMVVAEDEELRQLPGLVCGALGSFLLRLQQEEVRNGLSEDERASLTQAYDAMERIASSNDLELQNLVQTEILEHLNCEEAILEVIIKRSGKKTKELYSDLIKRNSPWRLLKGVSWHLFGRLFARK